MHNAQHCPPPGSSLKFHNKTGKKGERVAFLQGLKNQKPLKVGNPRVVSLPSNLIRAWHLVRPSYLKACCFCSPVGTVARRYSMRPFVGLSSGSIDKLQFLCPRLVSMVLMGVVRGYFLPPPMHSLSQISEQPPY